jgi:acyl carrier protein
MTRDEIRSALLDTLASVAPEADLDALKPERPLRDQLDIDSFDFLNVVVRLHDKLGVDIPEADYPKLITLNGALDYLETRLTQAPIALNLRSKT